MLKVLHVCQRVLLCLGKVELLWLGSLGIALVLMVSVGIGARYLPMKVTGVLTAPIEELSRLTLVWLVFWGASWVHGEDGHYKVTILVDHLGRRTRSVLLIVSNLAVTGFSLFMVIYAGQVLKSSADSYSLIMHWPVNVWTYGFVVGMGLITIYSVRRLILEIRGLFRVCQQS